MARGKRKPAVGGPGALSQRTDLAPGGQPNRVAPGGAYGERKALESQQAGAPLASSTPPRLPGGGSGRPGAAAPTPVDVFGPSQRPTQSGLAGSRANSPAVLPEDPDMLLRAMYSIQPNSYLLRLIQRR